MCFKKLTKWCDKCVKKLKWYDISLVKLTTFAFALMIAVLWPPILSLGWKWYLVIAIVAAIIPCMKMFSK